jgi:DNA replication protein DnaC
VLEDVSSTIVANQLEPKQWHAVIGDERIADAICDRLVHNALRVKLGGESIRKMRSDLTKETKPARWRRQASSRSGGDRHGRNG